MVRQCLRLSRCAVLEMDGCLTTACYDCCSSSKSWVFYLRLYRKKTNCSERMINAKCARLNLAYAGNMATMPGAKTGIIFVLKNIKNFSKDVQSRTKVKMRLKPK